MCEDYIGSQELTEQSGGKQPSEKNALLQNVREDVLKILPPLCYSPKQELGSSGAVRGISFVSVRILKHEALGSHSGFSGLPE